MAKTLSSRPHDKPTSEANPLKYCNLLFMDVFPLSLYGWIIRVYEGMCIIESQYMLPCICICRNLTYRG